MVTDAKIIKAVKGLKLTNKHYFEAAQTLKAILKIDAFPLLLPAKTSSVQLIIFAADRQLIDNVRSNILHSSIFLKHTSGYAAYL